MSAARKMDRGELSAREVFAAKSPRDSFVILLTQGFWPVAIYPRGVSIPGRDRPSEGKEPIGKAWGLERWTLERANEAFRKWKGAGAGICLGPGRGPDETWQIDVEGDGPEAEASRAKLYGGEDVDTMGWASVRGGHQLLVCDGERLAAIMPGLKALECKGATGTGVYKSPELPGLELRIGGYKPDGTVKQIQSVVPPTPGTDGRGRVWTGPARVARAPDSFYQVLGQLAVKPPGPDPLKVKATSGSRFAGEASSSEWPPERRAAAYLEKCEPAISKQRGHDKAFKAACKVGPGFDLLSETAFRLLWEVYNPTCDPPWSEAELRHKVEEAYKVETRRGWLLKESRKRPGAERNGRGGKPPGGGNGQACEPPGPEDPRSTCEAHGEGPPRRPEIEVNTHRFEVVEHSLKALRSDLDLYRRGDSLVTVVQEESNLIHLTSRTTMGGVAGSPKIIILSDAVIGDRLTRYAEFFQWKKDRNGEFVAVPAHPPDWLIKTIATRKYWPGIRPLIAVAECPFPRPDGTLVEASGYDEATAILYAPAIDFPKVPEKPSRDDARACWERIKRYVRHFPFASEDDRVVFLAGMLNVIARHGVIGAMPGIAVNGNKAGIGKGFLVDSMTIPGTGRIAPISKYPHDKEEAGKVKTSIVRSGKTVVSFDNLSEGTMYGGEDVDSLITARITDDRILGASDNTGDLIVRLVCFVNGNNIGPMKDAWRRWMVINLVTELEHPERRDDIRDEQGNVEKDIDALMLENRGEIVRDALTILRAHALAGWPNDGWAALGSFGDWDRIVRGAVWFATDRDCLATQERAAEESQDRRDRLALLEGLWELPGGKMGERGVTCIEAVAMVEANPDDYHTLRNALIARGQKGKPADSRALGNILRGMIKTPTGGFKLLKHPILKHQAVAWVVERTFVNDPERGENQGESGESGESNSSAHRRGSESYYDVNGSGESCKVHRDFVETVSPDSPDSPPDVSRIRATVNTWSAGWREQFGKASNRFAEQGNAWPDDEIRAFAEISKRIADINRTSGWD